MKLFGLIVSAIVCGVAWASLLMQMPPVAVTSIVTSGLVFQLDAAKYNGTTFPGTGCSITTWTNLINTAFNGTLTGFSGCSTDGWTGTGVPASPYALSYNGTSDYVVVTNTSNAIDFTNTDSTIQMWVNMTNVGNTTDPRLIDAQDSHITSIQIAVNGGTPSNWVTKNSTFQSSNAGFEYGVVSNSTWYNVALTNAHTALGMNFYINDALQTQNTFNSIGAHVVGGTITVGQRNDHIATLYFAGQMPTVYIYNRILSQSEIAQNCKALVGRFSGATCN